MRNLSQMINEARDRAINDLTDMKYGQVDKPSPKPDTITYQEMPHDMQIGVHRLIRGAFQAVLKPFVPLTMAFHTSNTLYQTVGETIPFSGSADYSLTTGRAG